MANKKVFTDESLVTFVDEIRSYADNAVSKKANTNHNHAASNITSGTLSSDRLPTIPISKGGTGATTASGALTNLGITATASELNKLDGVTATTAELNYVDGVTSNIQEQLDGKSNTSHTHNTTYIPDTRSDNQTPAWYISNYPNQVITEFKSTSTIGLSGPTYCELTTYVQWGNNSGGYPSQETIINGRIYTRYGTSDTAWSNWKTNIDSENISSQSVATSASCTGNSATATKLQTARTIGLGTGVTGTATSFNGTGNITIPVTDVKESYLSWGGKNLVGYVSPIGAALSTEHSANRIAYLNPNAIKIEYSNNAGSSWTDSGLANSAKTNLVTTANGVSVGSNATVTTSHRTRITLTAQDGTNGYVYTRPRKMLINVSTPHGLTVTIEAKSGVSGASWTTLGTYELSGWSGWNDIPIGISTFGGGANQTSNYWYMRLTFANTSVNSSYSTTKSSIIGLRLFGDTCWTRTSNMGETGHIYSYDSSQNTTFPANVTATTFVGALSGNANTATTATKLGSSVVGSATQPIYLNNGTPTACTYTIGKSVPSDAVFTDTNTKVTNTLATTTKAYVTGTTSSSTNTGTQVFDTGVYLDTTAGQLTATTFNGTTFKGSGVATLAEVQSYLGI